MKHKIIEIEGLRGFLSLWVFVFHIIAITGFFDTFFQQQAIKNIFNGETAVDVFIIVSGFTICMLIESKHEKFSTYLFRRFMRIYPMYIICLIVALLLGLLGIMPKNYDENDLYKHIGLHITMLHGIIPPTLLKNSSGAILNPAWSISLEWQFYLIAPFLFGITNKIKLVGPLFVLILSIILIRLASRYGEWDGSFLLSKFSLFWVGIFCYYVFDYVIRTKEKLFGLAVWLVPVALFMYSTLFSYKGGVGAFIWFLFFFGLLSSIINPKLTLPSIMLALFRTRLFKQLGEISYSLYLLHELVIWIILWALLKLNPQMSNWTQLLVLVFIGIPAASALAKLSYRFIEFPAVNWAKKKLVKNEG
ncbi:acyltransferase family protein [Pedobacter sp. KBW01]|uniref:acyltransferase family protein n=1 Tax=Pedobacter sp. KBW01 TaxID=2153364 RepID=UPI001319F59F|nr:acyltransferase [Pedobacter sp. KBW01]